MEPSISNATVERRAHPRFAVDNTTAVVTDDQGRTTTYKVLNFSAGGLLITQGPELCLGDQLSLHLCLPNQQEIQLSGSVVRQTGKTKKAFGIAFVSLTADLEDTLQDAILTVLEEHHRAMLPRLLIVDDCPDVARALKRDLQWFGGLIDIATSKEEALAIAGTKETQPDAAIVDLFVGDDDGLQVLQTMKQQLPKLRCVLISGAVQLGQLRLAQISGRADHVLPKPWSKEMLKTAIGDIGSHTM